MSFNKKRRTSLSYVLEDAVGALFLVGILRPLRKYLKIWRIKKFSAQTMLNGRRSNLLPCFPCGLMIFTRNIYPRGLIN